MSGVGGGQRWIVGAVPVDMPGLVCDHAAMVTRAFTRIQFVS
jgi:hypothetical protein